MRPADRPTGIVAAKYDARGGGGGGGGGGGRGHSGTEGGRTRVTYFAEEGVFFEDLRMSAIL